MGIFLIIVMMDIIWKDTLDLYQNANVIQNTEYSYFFARGVYGNGGEE